jgi:hypothetical protein
MKTHAWPRLAWFIVFPLLLASCVPAAQTASPTAATATAEPVNTQAALLPTSVPTAVPIPSLAPPSPAAPVSLPCPTAEAGGLITELQRIEAGSPGANSDGMKLPSDDDLLAFTAALQSLTADDPDSACTWLGQYDLPYEVVDFTDIPFGRHRYWLLRETVPISAGWGTYVIRQGEGQAVVVEVPHPQADSRTRSEGATLFRALQARALLVAGAHRCANQAYAPCGGTTIACGQVEPYRTSDVAHAVRTAFQTAHTTLAACGSNVITVQLHGNSLDTCPDLFISNGTTYPGSLAKKLYDEARLACQGLSVDLADGEEGECGFIGDGVQAAYSLGCGVVPTPDACTSYVSRPRGPDTYLSLEQSWGLRQDYSCVVESLMATLGAEE